jgi:hypothetical protein
VNTAVKFPARIAVVLSGKAPLMDETPKRPWWRRRRAITLAGLLVVLAYPLSFAPACWVLMRTGPAVAPFVWRVIREAHRPTAYLLKWSPADVRETTEFLVNRGRPEIIGGINIAPGRITVDLVKHRLAEPGLTIRMYGYTVGHTLW